GGAMGMALSSFSRAEGNEGFKARITRNVQLVLLHESGIAQTQDPAAGSYFLEELSFALSEQAWDAFIEIQDQGGYSAFLQGNLEQVVAEASEKVKSGIKTRKTFFLGVNQYPSALEKTSPFEASNASYFSPLHASEIFHRLKGEGSTRKACLLKAGNVAMRNARAGFVDNFLRCGNWEVNEVVWDGESLPKADLFVLCAADEDYPSLIQNPLIKGVPVFIAGHPGEKESEYRHKGIQGFIHIKSPLFDTLKSLEVLSHA
ncbi:MAG: methylmalonyl-CoA mutase family protein, partial [Bacteroidota bacterium]|nr:methylmalonyl-CoA mutase family protein [Bacteroidota bacterium]MDX5430477.1 methylmalonyl-CoA mutase family protein [Bacteroidota bacterium]MDX5469238.1 methylmalonyl-CoA mutase family protein [Bacteroidota bacterium]